MRIRRQVAALLASSALITLALVGCSDDDNGTGGDTTAPVATLVNPGNGDYVGAETTIEVEATDNVGVTRVVFFVDSVAHDTVAMSPWESVWDSESLVVGESYTVHAEAFDAAGNRSSSETATVSLADSLGDFPDPPEDQP